MLFVVVVHVVHVVVIIVDTTNLSLKFCWYQIRNSWEMDDIRPGKSCKRPLRTFCRKSHYFEDILSQISSTFGWGWRKKSWKWRIEVGQRRFEVGECGNKDLKLKMEGGGLLIEDWQSGFEDSIVPHQYLKHIFLFILCRESRYFEDNVNMWIFRLRMIYDFFQVLSSSTSMTFSTMYIVQGLAWISPKSG